MSRALRVVLASFSLALSAQAQFTCVTITPNPGSSGAQISVTIAVTDATGGGFDYLTNCWVFLHSGTPNGPVLPLLQPFCQSYVTVAGHGTVTDTKTIPAGLAAPGLYYFRVRTGPAGSGTQANVEWYPFVLQANLTDPTLSAAGPPTLGSLFTMTVSSPMDPLTPYVAAASLSTNVGYSLGAGMPFISLDVTTDTLLFPLSFPNPNPGLFANFQGLLDGSGTATNVAMLIPNVPALQYLPLHFQVAVLPLAGGTKLTNPLSSCIQ